MTYQHLEVERDKSTVGFQPQASLSVVKERVENLLRQKGLTLTWLQERCELTKTGYREMWQRESVRVVVIQRIAQALGVELAALLDAEDVPLMSVVSEPPATYARPQYLEERVALLERELQALKQKLTK